jgi:hypothetical protein
MGLVMSDPLEIAMVVFARTKKRSFFLQDYDTKTVRGSKLVPGNTLVVEDDKGRLTAGVTLAKDITRLHSLVRHRTFTTETNHQIRCEPTALFRIVA